MLIHHIYEFRKGLRNLVMHTLPSALVEEAKGKLRYFGIEYHIQPCVSDKVTIYFGSPGCVDVVRRITHGKKLVEMTPEEDFMLGSMLGYGVQIQCERYLKKCGAFPVALSVQKCA